MAQRSNTLNVKLPILEKISVDYQFINVLSEVSHVRGVF